ncbi:4'-phosphopantetheinyl transferase superfamily protein [Streptomyces sp. NPDC008125]|uniref:4'-phosphopantetheinyl transferase family protein n=1 Tax=Streptomyces sp. NPDC008125 TaxID=3364811 RepID=UPI0036EBD539
MASLASAAQGVRTARTFTGRVSGALGRPSAAEGPHLWSLTAVDRLIDESVLDGAESARAAGMRGTRRREYLAAHTALRLLLGGYLSMEPEEVRFVRHSCPCCDEPHGRPAVPGDAVHFSLSHSHGEVLLAFAAAPVGVDVQKVPGLRTADRTADLLTPLERQELAAHDAATRPTAFARVWARKEAYLKGLGTGFGREASSDHVGAGDTAVSPYGWTLHDIASKSGYAAAVAVKL